MASIRLNAAIVLAISAWLAHRIRIVGLQETVAEAVGLTNFDLYNEWRDRYRPLHAHLYSASGMHAALQPSLRDALGNETARSEALRALTIPSPADHTTATRKRSRMPMPMRGRSDGDWQV